ncbi:MAG: hypothetical protein WC829_14245 [Hyphomicrobium sp.]|jgi:hypothetical protein
MCSAAAAVLLLAAPRAMANCSVSTGPSPDTIVCSGADTNGVSHSTTEIPLFTGDNLNVTIDPGASVTGSGTNMNLTVNRNLSGAPVLNFDMNAPNSVISGNGTQIDATLLGSGAGTATFNIAGDIESSAGNGIVLNLGGTATFNIASTSSIEAAGNGITINNIALPGNTTVNNAGQIYGGTDGTGNGIEINRLLGAGSIAVHNTGVIGSTAQPVGSTAVAIFATDPNGNDVIVTNAPSALPNAVLGSGTIYSTGNSINITQIAGGGGTQVTNSGAITSTAGQAINILKLNGDTRVENAAGGDITSFGTSINISQGGGITNVKNFGSIESTNGGGVNIVKGVGDTTVTNRTDASITAKNTAINIDQGGGMTTVMNDGLVKSTAGLGVDVLNAAGPISVTNSQTIQGSTGGVRATSALSTVAMNNEDGSVTTTDGTGVLLASGFGTTFTGASGTVESTNGSGIIGIAATGGVTIDSGTTHAGSGGVVNIPGVGNVGGGVIGVAAVTGDATVRTHGETTVATGGMIGVGAISTSGAASVTLGGAIDPPLIGSMSVVLGGSSDASIDTDGFDVTADNIGLLGLNLGTGKVIIDATGSTVTQTAPGALNVGIAGLGQGAVDIDYGTVDAAGSGVVGLSTAAGVAIDAHGNVKSGGFLGVGAFAGNGNAAITLGSNSVENTSTGGLGVIAAANSGNAIVSGAGSTVTSDGTAVTGLSLNGNVDLDTGTVTSTGDTGVFGLAINGGSAIDLHGAVQANGDFGVFSTAIDLGSGSGDSAVNLGGQNVTNTGGTGVFSLALGGHSSVTGGAGGTVTSATDGIASTAFLGDSTVNSGDVDAGGSGILSTAIDGGSSVTLGGDVLANGAFGVFSTAVDLGAGSGDSTVDLGGQNVTNDGGIGVFSLAIGGNSKVENGGAGLITSLDEGIISTAFLGNSTVDVNAVTSGGTGIVSTALGGDSNATAQGDITSTNGSGIISTAIGGNATATNNGKVTADSGTYGIAAFSIDGNATATANGVIDPPLIGVSSFTIGNGVATSTVNNAVSADLIGAFAGNIGGGNVVVDVTEDGSIDSGFLGILATNTGPGATTVGVAGMVTAADDAINVANFINNGDISVTTTTGLTTAGTLAAGDDAVDITKIGGSGTINVALGANATAADDGVTIFRTLSGSNAGDVNNITVGLTASALAATGGDGIQIVTPFAANDIAVNVDAASSVTANNGSAIAVLSFSALPGEDNDVTVTNAGSLVGDGGFLTSTILAGIDGNLIVNNTGSISGDAGSRFESIVGSVAGGSNTITNSGTMTGNMQLAAIGGDNTVTNQAGGSWATAGISLLVSLGNNTIANEAGGTIDAGPFTAIGMIGNNNEINNAGTFNSTGFNVYGMFGNTNTVNNSGAFNVTGFTQFLGGNFGGQNLAFNNAGGVLSMQNTISDYGFITPVDLGLTDYGNGIGDITQIGIFNTTGNTFNGSGYSRYAIDAFLDAPTTSSSDLLLINGDTTGVTALQVNDTNAGPGSYNPTGILVAHVEGNSDPDAFYLEGGPIDKGLFTYDLYRVQVSSFDWLLASTPDQTFFELPHLISAAQNMWHNSAGVWLDRTADLRASVAEKCAMMGSLKDSQAVCSKSVTPGAWAKVLGNTSEREQSYSFTILNKTSTFQVNSNQDGYGVVGGYDFGHETRNGAWMIGAMGGYVASNLDFDGSTTDVDYRTGLVGAYATWIEGGWFVDGKVLANFGKYEYSNSTSTGLSTQDKQDVRSIGGVLDTGYRMNYAHAFIEPGATLSYVKSDLDDASIYGTAVHFEDGNSLRGRLGLRLGTSYVSGGHKLEPFIGASAWHEFDGDNKISLSSGGYDLVAQDDTGGTFGEVSGGLNVFSLGSDGVSGFVKGNVQFGEDNLRGYSGNAGVRVNW